MKRLALVSLVAALGAVLAPASLAKGPSAAEIDGPGLKGPIAITGFGEPGSPSSLGQLVEHGGFFSAVFGQTPDPMLSSRPSGDLGPLYRITFTVPGPNSSESTIVQETYPYATPQPVTYMKPGQPFWDGQGTHGGWFLGTPELKQALVSAGLPEAAPNGGRGWSWPVTTLVSSGAAMLVVAILLLLRRGLRSASSRRPQAI